MLACARSYAFPSSLILAQWWNKDPNWFKEAHPPPPPPNAPTQLVLEQVAVAHTVQKLQHKIVHAVTTPSTTSTSTTSTEHVPANQNQNNNNQQQNQQNQPQPNQNSR